MNWLLARRAFLAGSSPAARVRGRMAIYGSGHTALEAALAARVRGRMAP